jgi:immune inhibitor A
MEREKKSSSAWVILGFLGLTSLCMCLLCLATCVFLTLGVRELFKPIRQPAPLITTTTYATDQVLSSVEVPMSDPVSLAERLQHLEDVPRVLAEKADPLPVGAKDTFWVTNVDQNVTNQVEATLIYSTEHVYFWAGVDVVTNIEDVRRVVDHFEEVTYPTVRSIIGSEWSPGVDGDAHLYILYVRGLGPSVAGLFFSKDEYSPLVQEHSNGHEMFYISADSISLAENYVDSVLGHEFQHMIHWNLDRNEDTWVNEGFSEMIEHLLGYQMGGFDYLYSRNTDIPLLRWPSEVGSAGEHYGQAFLFMTYLYNRLGTDFIRSLAAHPANGINAIDEVLAELKISDATTGERLSADDIVLDWAISLALQNPGIGEGHYGMRSYAAAPIAQFSKSYSLCPLAEQTNEDPASRSSLRIICLLVESG